MRRREGERGKGRRQGERKEREEGTGEEERGWGKRWWEREGREEVRGENEGRRKKEEKREGRG